MIRYMATGRSTVQSYDDIWVLSLPQFLWTQVYTGVRPTYGATCHLVGKKQMLVLGGKGDHPSICAQGNYVWLYDLTNLKWMPGYDLDDAEFRVPKAVWDWIGGS
jgi:hypothetical protein